MIGMLASGNLTVGQLADPFDMSLAAASKHVQVLEKAGLVRRDVQGRQHVCRLEAGPLASASAWLRGFERFWPARATVEEPAPPRVEARSAGDASACARRVSEWDED